MAIALNASQCCCGSDYPAWTVYHSNVSKKLHYYLSFATLDGKAMSSPVALFYEGLSGDYLVYKNCPYFSSTLGGTGPNAEVDINSSYRIYLQHTDVAPTGASTENTWIKAARVEKVEISGQFFGPFAAIGPLNLVLTYNSSNPQYTMGNHYCGCSGFSGALTQSSGSGLSAFTLYPLIAGKAISTNTSSAISQWTTNGDTFNQYRVVEFADVTPRTNFGTSQDAFFIHSTGILHYSSGLNSASKTLIWSNSGCSCFPGTGTYVANQYEFTFNVSNYVSGTRIAFSTYKYSIEIPGTMQSCVPSYSRNLNLSAYNSYLPPVGSFFFTPSSYYNFADLDLNLGGNTRFGQTFFGYGDANGACSDILIGPPDSGIYFCISGNNPSGYSFYNYTTTPSGASTSGILVSYKPILATMKVINVNHREDIVSQYLFDDNIGNYCGGSYQDPTGAITQAPTLPSRSIHYNFNYDVSIGILNTFPSKHVLEDFNLDSDFDTLTITPWFGSLASGNSALIVQTCPATGTGIYSNVYGVSGAGTGIGYAYGCPLGGGPGPFPGVYSLPRNCETYYNVNGQTLDFTNLQLIVPSSELCL